MAHTVAPTPEPVPTDSQRPPAVPSRVLPDRVARRQWLPPFLARRIFGAPLAPTAAEWDAVKAALWRGDPPMDRVAAWIFEGRPSERKALFERALTQGIDSLDDPPAPLRELFALLDAAPAWLDRALLEEGIRTSQLPGETAVLVLRDMALMGGYAYFNSANQTLARAGVLTKDTALRIAETGKWIEDVTEKGGLDRFGPGFISTVRVRMIHALVRRHLGARADWEGERWGLPINQVDMLATYLAFGPVALLGARLFGVPIRRSQAAAIMHMWRYVGYLSGVDERFLATTEGDGLRKLYHTSLTHRRPDDNARLLGQALMREPLTRHVPGLEDRPWLTAVVRRFAYHRHLSNSALILGPVRRRQLGLPLFTVPWYPLVSAPFRFAALAYFQLRGGEVLKRYLERTRERQKRTLDAYFGGTRRQLLQPTAAHPAFVEKGLSN